MAKPVSATVAKNRLGSLLTWVRQEQDEVIVESRGEPPAVSVPFARVPGAAGPAETTTPAGRAGDAAPAASGGARPEP